MQASPPNNGKIQRRKRHAAIVEDINFGITEVLGIDEAENLNIAHSYNKILESEIVTEMVRTGEIARGLVQAKYDISTGKVKYFEWGD